MGQAIDESVGKAITAINLEEYEVRDDNRNVAKLLNHFPGTDSIPVIRIAFQDDSALLLLNLPEYSGSHSITCDDDLSSYIGSQFVGAEIRAASETCIKPGMEDNYEDDSYESIGFLNVATSQGSFTAASHSIHNGGYGEFHLMDAVDDRPAPQPVLGMRL